MKPITWTIEADGKGGSNVIFNIPSLPLADFYTNGKIRETWDKDFSGVTALIDWWRKKCHDGQDQHLRRWYPDDPDTVNHAPKARTDVAERAAQRATISLRKAASSRKKKAAGR